jgi:alanine racemase
MPHDSGLGADRALPCGGRDRVAGKLDIEINLELRENSILAMWRCSLAARTTRGLCGAIDAELDFGVSTVGQLDAITAAGASSALRYTSLIDTGLHRNGASIEDWPEARIREPNAIGQR